jgi:8-oxo-dGTP pyrophosphatase MutT (NUDIX family)
VNGEPVPLADRPARRDVLSQQVRHIGGKWSLVTDEVRLPDDVLVRRDVVVHPGAVGILALDDSDRVVLIRQYRHPVGAELWELPAGLLDVAEEGPLEAARRELFEEAHLVADEWHVLLDLYSSPGMSSEVVRVYLARQLHIVPESDRHMQTEEEADMPSRRVALTDACAWALGGQLHNAMAVAGLLAADRSRQQGWASLRPADTAWPTAE